MKKLDGVLLLGILILLTAQGLFLRPVRTGSSWQKRQQAVEDRIERALSEKKQTLQEEIDRRPEIRWRFRLASFGSSVILVGSAAAFLHLLFCLFTRRPFYRRIGEPAPPAWGFPQILRTAAAAWLAVHAAALAEVAVLSLFRPAWLDRPVVSVANTLLADGVVLAAALVLFRRGRGPENPPRRWAGIGFALRYYLTFLPFLALLLLALAALMRAIHYAPGPQPVFTIFLSESRFSVLMWLLILVTVIGPTAEEVFFRGVFYGWLRTRFGVARALIFSALVFALLHADPVAFVPIFALGLLFGWVYEQTGTLAAPIAIHVLHNGAMLYGVFLVKTVIDLAGR